MSERLPAIFLGLLYEALLKSFWTKRGLKSFLRRSHIAANFLAQLQESETKRDWLDRLFPLLEESEKGRLVLQQMAATLSEQSAFPDLESWENSANKIGEAKVAVQRLKEYIGKSNVERTNVREARERREAAERLRDENRRATLDLAKLKDALEALTSRLGTPEGGYQFQDWFYDLMAYSEVDNRRPYVEGGRQIDGSLTVDGTTYLVELKFTAEQASAPDVDSLLSKVNTKSDNTMGVMISMSGYSGPAVKAASFAKSPVLLLTHEHIYAALLGTHAFADVVRRVRRHASQTGEALLTVGRFGTG